MLLLKQWNFQSSVFVMVSSIVGSLVVLTNKYIWNILIKAHNIKPISAQALTRKTNRSHKEFCFFMKQKIIIIFKTMNNNIISKMKRKKTKKIHLISALSIRCRPPSCCRPRPPQVAAERCQNSRNCLSRNSQVRPCPSSPPCNRRCRTRCRRRTTGPA